jgi:hypothetical protein
MSYNWLIEGDWIDIYRLDVVAVQNPKPGLDILVVVRPQN